MRAIARMTGLNLVVPDYSTISRRGKGLRIAQERHASNKSITLIMDRTGLKIHDGCGWHKAKHGTSKARKTWRKLHIALDPGAGTIAAAKLTTEHVGDDTALLDLLASIDAGVAQFLADGAYDGQGVADCLATKFGPEIECVIPSPKNAVHDANVQRNQYIDAIAEHGRTKWQSQTGYNQRSQVEAQIGRWKQVIGDRRQAREFDDQTVEAQIASKALNRVTPHGLWPVASLKTRFRFCPWNENAL